MKKMTHKGMVVGNVHNRGITKEVKLRETKKYYISEYGTKYKKGDGSIPSEIYPILNLDLPTIKEL